jgi:hypothetical protein
MAVREAGPETNGESSGRPDYTSLFEATDFTALIKPAQSAVAKEYSGKVKSLLKAGTIGAINIGDFADAAAFLHYGPGFADATGQLAEADKRARAAVDILTAPGNPYAMFLVTGIPLIAQLFRNHEEQIQELPNVIKNGRKRRKAMATAKKAETPRFTLRAFGREWPVRFRVPKVGRIFSGFRTQTQDPSTLAERVFLDPAVQRALRKQGIVLVRQDEQAKS